MKNEKTYLKVLVVFCWIMAVTMALQMVVNWPDRDWARWFYLALTVINTANAVWSSVNYYRYSKMVHIARVVYKFDILEDENNENAENQMDIY